MNSTYLNKSIVLFDGECNFCNKTIQFILKHEKKPELLFCSLQSETGKEIQDFFKLHDAKSVLLVENNILYTKSTAALKITTYLKGGLPLLYFFIIVPLFIRNSIYNYIAKNRYKWFGKTETCMTPNNQIKHRFI
jgi:predicted DCC family thiol-disulfide oxidoreductase YuxK